MDEKTMDDPGRPTLYYLFQNYEDIDIRAMSDVKASEVWNAGERWLGAPCKTQAEAEELRRSYLSQTPPKPPAQ